MVNNTNAAQTFVEYLFSRPGARVSLFIAFLFFVIVTYQGGVGWGFAATVIGLSVGYFSTYRPWRQRTAAGARRR